jgi:cation diffusion facilitator CzcD-associated flavoprotein CzcO
MPTPTDTVIIGAGPAGLAVGAALRRADVPFVLLERGQHVGEAWHHHYDRLRLHTPKGHSALPYRPYPRAYPRYPSRREVVAYLEDYARAFDLRPEFGREVRRCARRPDGAWEVATDAGPYRALRVVVATGFSSRPYLPRWPGQDGFPGPILHSRDYTNGAAFRGQRVLVVGFGNSGAEIALDLLEHGARPAVAVRGPVNVIPRDLLGIPIIVCALACRRLAPRVADALNALALRLAVGDLASAGLVKRADGPFTQVAEGRQTPVIDVGTMARIRRGEIAVRRGVESFDGPDVRFADGTRERFDAAVLATGFTTGLPALLPDYPSVLDGAGRPRAHGREAAVPGLYFCGYDPATTGLLRQLGLEARAIARDIAAKARDGCPDVR